jgi:hypothetical protein
MGKANNIKDPQPQMNPKHSNPTMIQVGGHKYCESSESVAVKLYKWI